MDTKKKKKTNPRQKKPASSTSSQLENKVEDNQVAAPPVSRAEYLAKLREIARTKTRTKSDRITASEIKRFLSVLELTGSVEKASIAGGAHSASWYALRKRDPAFAEQWAAAKAGSKDILIDQIETEMHRRAIEGVQEPVYQGGKLVGTVTKYSDPLLIRMAQAHVPEYKEKKVDAGQAINAMAEITQQVIAALAEIAGACQPIDITPQPLTIEHVTA